MTSRLARWIRDEGHPCQRPQSLVGDDGRSGAGGVGSAVVQLLVRYGVTVIGTASEANHDYLRTLGAIPVSYGDGLVDRIRAVAPTTLTAATLPPVVDLATRGEFTIPIARTFTFEEIPAAQRLSEGGHDRGEERQEDGLSPGCHGGRRSPARLRVGRWGVRQPGLVPQPRCESGGYGRVRHRCLHRAGHGRNRG